MISFIVHQLLGILLLLPSTVCLDRLAVKRTVSGLDVILGGVSVVSVFTGLALFIFA